METQKMYAYTYYSDLSNSGTVSTCAIFKTFREAKQFLIDDFIEQTNVDKKHSYKPVVFSEEILENLKENKDFESDTNPEWDNYFWDEWSLSIWVDWDEINISISIAWWEDEYKFAVSEIELWKEFSIFG